MRVAFVFPCGHLLSTPCLVSLIKLLAARGIAVDVYTAVNDTSSWEGGFPELGEENIKVYLYPLRSQRYQENIPTLLLGFGLWYMARKASTRYDLTIAAGIRGLFLQGCEHIIRREPFIYLSLELYFQEEMPPISGRIIKFLEIFFNRRAALTLIQDDLRAAVLADENRLDPGSIAIFPNSALTSPAGLNHGPSSSKGVHPASLNWKVALYSGSIFDPWAMSKELAEEVQGWPEDWVLLIHSKAKLNGGTSFLQPGKSNFPPRVILSDTPLSVANYEKMVAAAMVGIALYDGSFSKNLLYLGYSSGKIADYLRLGKPIIVNDLPKLKDMVEKNQCGVVIRHLSEIGHALQLISSDYESYSQNAFRTFKQLLDPERYIEKVIESMKHIYV